MKRAILVFLKYPSPGRVKTRLAQDLGEEAAALAYQQLVCRVFEQIRAAGAEVIAIAFDPSDEMEKVQRWLDPLLGAYYGEVWWIPQGEGDLGGRLSRVTGEVFRREPELQLAVVGTDCVELEKPIFEAAWTALSGDSKVVFGPAEDGGYYLVGMCQARPELFEGIPWSAPNTLEESLAVCERDHLEVSLLPWARDVDTLTEWRRVEAVVSNRRCVFFDRDGVVNQSPGPGYVLNVDAFHLNEGIAEAIQWLKERGWLVILVTSQKGVGKGLMKKADLEAIHRRMQSELSRLGAAFDAIYAFTGESGCPHQAKPDPEMILSAAESFFIDRRQSWMVGDADRDIEMGQAAGLAGTVRIEGEKKIGIPADQTLKQISGLKALFERVL